MGAVPDTASGRIERREVTAAKKRLEKLRATPQYDAWGRRRAIPHHSPLAQAAIDKAHSVFDDRRYDHGHAGYSGTMAEKHDVIVKLLGKDLTENQWGTLDEMVTGWEWDDKIDIPRTWKTLMKKLGSSHAEVQAWYDIYDDKWGPALMLVTPDRRWWLGGWCSS